MKANQRTVFFRYQPALGAGRTKLLTETQWNQLKFWACGLADPTCLADYIVSLEEDVYASAPRLILSMKDYGAILDQLVSWARSQDLEAMKARCRF